MALRNLVYRDRLFPGRCIAGLSTLSSSNCLTGRLVRPSSNCWRRLMIGCERELAEELARTLDATNCPTGCLESDLRSPDHLCNSHPSIAMKP
jgi:hypothetical protein